MQMHMLWQWPANGVANAWLCHRLQGPRIFLLPLQGR